jgi:hypothetical protein
MKKVPDRDKTVRRAIDAAKGTEDNSSGKSDHSIKGLERE